MKKLGRIAMGMGIMAARKFAANRFRTLTLIQKAFQKAQSNKNLMPEIKDDFFTLLEMVKAWAKREYPHAPIKSITLAIGAILYFASPLDAISDFIPGMGLVDDIAVLTYVLRAIRKDLDNYREWKSNTFETTGRRVA